MLKGSIRIIARIVANPNSMDQVCSILTTLVEPTRKESGCIRYELLQNRSDPTDFTFVEEWLSDASIDAHLRTEHVMTALTKLSDLVPVLPDIRTLI